MQEIYELKRMDRLTMSDIKRSRLTAYDLDVLSNMMLIFFHAGERCLQVAEEHFVTEHRASTEYKALCKRIGKPSADLILKEKAHKLLQHEEKFKYGEIIRRAEQLKNMMDNVTSVAIGSTAENVNSFQAYDYLHADVNWLCKIYALITNCLNESDALKIESTIKLLAKGNLTSEEVINSFG